MRRLSWSILFVSLLLAAQPARAGGRDASERTARKACLAGDYAKGAAILSDLFVSTKNATYIFNQGRCFEQNHRYEDALSRFQEYLRVGDNLSAKDKADAEKHAADCQEILAKQNGQVAPAAPVARVPPPPVVARPPVESQPLVVQQTNTRPARETGSGLRTAGIVTAAVGGAALVAGVVMNLKVNRLASDLQKTNGYDSGKVSDRNSYETLGWVGYGVGAACVATGAVLYYLGLRAGAVGSAPVAFVPALAPGQAGAVLKGSF